ncbi:hypothetical protein [Enterococcus sp. AZ072]|uniref:hypothetical protein n=1 Tax=unclassified Enterococcus TaxID=2608891 RepID=UPI003D28D42A
MIVFYFLLLAGNRLHIIPAKISMVALFSFILIAITIIFGFIIVPAGEKNCFYRKGSVMAGHPIRGIESVY